MSIYERRFLTADERFDSLHTRGEDDECWPWLGGVSGAGYGVFWLDRANVSAHRYAWTRLHGPTNGLHVLHRCDNRICLNPAHMFIGTNADKVAKGRQASGTRAGPKKPSRGESHPRAKLTEEAVSEIRSAHIGYGDLTRLARKFGVSTQTVWHVRRGLGWRHVVAE